MKHQAKVAAKKILPPGTKRFRAARAIAVQASILSDIPPDVAYAEWVERSEPYTWSPVKELAYEPLISVVVPVFNPPANYLLPMVYSLVNQQDYENWELILVNASTKKKAQSMTKDCAAIDNRIKVVDLAENKGIAGNTNAGIKAARGDYIGLLDHDDVLSPRALYEVGLSLQRRPRPQFIYSDEDKLVESGNNRFDPFFKPDWSPYLFKHVNYLNHFSVIEKKLVESVGAYRKGFDGAQDYDLFLRLVDEKPVIHHIPKVLYHWRAAKGSTTTDFSSKKNITDASTHALQEHLERNKFQGKVSTVPKQPGFYNIDYAPRKDTTVAVLLLPSPAKDQYEKLVNAVASDLKKTRLHAHLYTCATHGDNPLSDDLPYKVTKIDDAENSHDFVQQVLKQAKEEVFVLINAATTPKKSDWIDRLAGLVVQNDDVCAASPLLYDPSNKTIADAGYIKQGSRHLALFEGLPLYANTYFGNSVWGRNVDSLSGRLMAVRRETFTKYLADFYSKKEDERHKIFAEMKSDGLEVVMCSDVLVKFNGDLTPKIIETENFNPNLISHHSRIGLGKTINMPEGGKDD